MPAATTDQPSAERINALYWESDQTVEEISDGLEIGRSTLYAAVRPIPAGATCATCGERMVFTNRTNRSAGTATCRACGEEASVEATQRAAPAATAGSRAPARSNGEDDDGMRGLSRWRRDLSGVEPERYALVGGAAALGVVLGAAAAKAFREMT